MSKLKRQFDVLAHRTNVFLASVEEEKRPRLTVDENADLRVKSFDPLRTVSFGDNFPWLKGVFRVDALETKNGTETGTIQIAAIVPVEVTWHSRAGYVGVFLEAGSAHEIMSSILGIEVPELYDVASIAQH